MAGAGILRKLTEFSQKNSNTHSAGLELASTQLAACCANGRRAELPAALEVCEIATLLLVVRLPQEFIFDALSTWAPDQVFAPLDLLRMLVLLYATACTSAHSLLAARFSLHQ